MTEQNSQNPSVSAGFLKLALICIGVMAIGIGLMQLLAWLTG